VYKLDFFLFGRNSTFSGYVLKVETVLRMFDRFAKDYWELEEDAD